MLILTRKKNRTVVVGDCMVTTVCQIDGNQVKIGIDALSEIPILREELVFESPNDLDNRQLETGFNRTRKMKAINKFRV